MVRMVGTSQPIHDAVEKATGNLLYAGDKTLPKMAHLAVIFSTIPHGYVKAVDATEALKIPGVYAVYHALNTPAYRFNHYRSQFQRAQDLPLEEGVFQQRVRFVGDRIGVVAANDEYTARKAAKLVRVTYEPLPAALTIDEALRGTHCLQDELPVIDEGTMAVGTEPEKEEGDIDITVHNELSRLHHAAMEPHACLASYNPAQDEIYIESPNQAVFGVRTVIADMLRMPYNRVHVVKSPTGGSFGCKQEWILEPVCAAVSKWLKRPVKLVYNRTETMLATHCRAHMRGSLRGIFSREGILKAVYMNVILDAGAYTGDSLDYVRAPFGKFFRCYRLPFATLHSRVVGTNTIPSGAFRSWGVAEYYLFMEHLMNKAAKSLRMDPVALRLKNVLLPGEWDIKMKLPVEEARTKECLIAGMKAFQWKEKRVADAKFNATNLRYKRGCAVGCAGHTNTFYTRFNDFAGVEMRLNDDGTVQANLSIHDQGCGTVTAFKMIAADALQIPMDHIYMGEADTAHTPYDYGCFSSRTTFMIGRAVEECGKNLCHEIIRHASKMIRIPQKYMYIQDGIVKNRQNAKTLSYEEVSQWVMMNERKEVFVHSRYHNKTNPTVTGSHFAHVEVDTWTGMTKVLDYVAVHDVGQAINPGMCIAQTQGAVQMGCGAALHEELVYDSSGMGTHSLSKYHLMNATELPDIKVILIQDGLSKEGPYGAKSIGEVGMAPVAAAVVGAVNEALQSDLQCIPFSPDRIVEYLRKQES